MQALKLTLVIFGLLVSACSSDEDAPVTEEAPPFADPIQARNDQTRKDNPAAADPGNDNLVFDGEDLAFSGEEETIQVENITFTDGFDDSPAENIVFESFDVPETDFSQAATETEPNEDSEAATELGIIPGTTDGDPQFAAQGTLTNRDTDYFSFSVEGEAQLYLIEALGPGVSRMTLNGAAGRIARGKTTDGWAGSSLTGIYLAPGDYRISVEQNKMLDESPYTLRVVPMGVPDRYQEREPNDVIADAETLVPEQPRSGLLAEPGDSDYYRFSLMAGQLVRLRVEPPPDLKLYFALKEGNQPVVTRIADEAGGSIEYSALLQPGDYNVVLAPKESTSTEPYSITLLRGNRFAPIIDLEPNDRHGMARALPSDGDLRGTARDFKDDDWYRMPEVSEPTSLTVHSENGKQRVFLHRSSDGKTKREPLEWSKEDSAFAGSLLPGESYFLQVSVNGEYAFQVAFEPEPETVDAFATRDRLANVSLKIEGDLPDFAAFWHESQRVDIPLSISNGGNDPVRLSLQAATTHPGWQVSEMPDYVDAGPGQTVTVPVRAELGPDFPAAVSTRFDFNIRNEQGALQLGSVTADASCGAEPVDPGTIWSLPDKLVGGFNMAWSGLGSRVVEAPDKGEAYLYDGLTPRSRHWSRASAEYPVDLTVELAGAEPVAVAGIILNPRSSSGPGTQVRDFELFLSVDGVDYRKVLSDRLSRSVIPQTFVLRQTESARFARLRILSSFDLGGRRVALGGIAVVADPEVSPFADKRLNLADPVLGGYVAWSKPRFSAYGSAEAMLTEGAGNPRIMVDPVIPTEWVIGFHHSRAAQISELQWVFSPNAVAINNLDRVQVSVSTESAAGPWTLLDNWELDRDSGPVVTLKLDEPVWARFVRFTVSDTASARRVYIAQTLRIFERDVGPDYRSILAEWGKYSSDGPLEWKQQVAGGAGKPALSATSNVSKVRALQVKPGVSYADEVALGDRTTWYRYDIPANDNRLRFSIAGDPVANVVAALENDHGEVIPLEEALGENGELIIEAEVDGGASYWLQLSEPIRHVAVVWDNSGSVAPYFAAIYGAINRFVREIQPGNEFVQLLPFRASGFLLDDWSDQTNELMRGLQSDPRTESSSNAEEFLLKASTALGLMDGAKAIIFVTDAESGGYQLTPELWQSLASARPRIFAVELHRGSGVAHQQDLMQSWASVNNGHYAYFSQQTDLDVAFDRAFCHLRRPVRFNLVADSRFEEPPGPGFLAVEAGDAIAANAVELILDASGSMLKRLDGTRRIEIARTVLTDLVNETLPEGTPLAMRIFGHRKPDACDTDLAVPLRPLDRAKVSGVIKATQAMNLARTPIGDSLAKVAEDLKGVDGQKLIILLTDGEETCDGDPAAAITELKEAGHDVRVNIVGFAIDDAALQAQFESWADLGGGLYFNTSSAAELDEALQQALRPKYQVLDDTGAIIADGTTGAGDLELPSGSYTVKILTSPVQTFAEVNIAPEEVTRITAN